MLRMTWRVRILWLVGPAMLVGAGCVLSAQENASVTLRPGQDIQAIVARSPEGTQFHLEPGIYRQQTIHPKDGQEFIGQDGAILSGAMELTDWRQASGLWRSERLPPPQPVHGDCDSGRDLCNLAEDLFVNGLLYQRVASLNDLGPGTWHEANGRAYLAHDPRGQLIELSVTPLAIGGHAEGVVLRNLVVEKYASPAQHGAIESYEGRGWLIAEVTARWNHGVGLSFGPRTRVKGGSFSHNGQLGMAGTGEGSRVQGVEIAFNNYAGYDPGWEAGGTKFYQTQGLVVRDSCIHHNAGPGLWTDIDNIDVIYDGNKVFLNASDGIKHEISYDAIIRNNIVAHNGTSGFDVWLWGSQILIQNSRNVKVHDNVVEVSGEFGNGIGVIHQDRGDGAYGPWIAADNRVHHNTIVHLGSRGQNGVVMDTDDDWFWSEADNGFESNTYIVADETSEYWTSNDRDAVWEDVGDLGFEPNSERIVEQRTQRQLSCGE